MAWVIVVIVSTDQLAPDHTHLRRKVEANNRGMHGDSDQEGASSNRGLGGDKTLP